MLENIKKKLNRDKSKKPGKYQQITIGQGGATKEDIAVEQFWRNFISECQGLADSDDQENGPESSLISPYSPPVSDQERMRRNRERMRRMGLY